VRLVPLAVIFRISVFDPKPTAGQAADPHSECKLILPPIRRRPQAHIQTTKTIIEIAKSRPAIAVPDRIIVERNGHESPQGLWLN
jgi:hypothetical protein